jgi:DASH complex subunit DAD3
MTTTVTNPDSIFETNPYETHPSLSPLEADVLWEYAKLSQHVKEVCISISFSGRMINMVNA